MPKEMKIFSEVLLPSGKRAVLPREPMGHDMERAYEATDARTGNIVAITLGLFAQVGEIDGVRVTYEELRHGLSALDVFRLTTWTNAGFPPLDALGASSTSDAPGSAEAGGTPASPL